MISFMPDWLAIALVVVSVIMIFSATIVRILMPHGFLRNTRKRYSKGTILGIVGLITLAGFALAMTVVILWKTVDLFPIPYLAAFALAFAMIQLWPLWLSLKILERYSR